MDTRYSQPLALILVLSCSRMVPCSGSSSPLCSGSFLQFLGLGGVMNTLVDLAGTRLPTLASHDRKTPDGMRSPASESRRRRVYRTSRFY